MFFANDARFPFTSRMFRDRLRYVLFEKCEKKFFPDSQERFVAHQYESARSIKRESPPLVIRLCISIEMLGFVNKTDSTSISKRLKRTVILTNFIPLLDRGVL